MNENQIKKYIIKNFNIDIDLIDYKSIGYDADKSIINAFMFDNYGLNPITQPLRPIRVKKVEALFFDTYNHCYKKAVGLNKRILQGGEI